MPHTPARKLLPSFQSEEEEVRFWGTHDPDEYFSGPEVSLDSLLGPEGEAALEYPTTEIGGIESLFTPEGIERLEALRRDEAAPPTKKRLR